MEVVNLFAYRSTDPDALYTADDPVGAENLSHIIEVANASDKIICAWGKHGKLRDAAQMVLEKLAEVCQNKTYSLRLNIDGSPEHPLYIPYAQQPAPYRW